MWIFCCGAKRSGSTLQYNIVSDLVESSKAGTRVEYVEAEDFLKVRQKYSTYSGYKVFKTHQLTQDIMDEVKNENALCIYSYRDIRDVVVSLRRKGWLTKEMKSLEQMVKDYIEEYESWMCISDKMLVRRYEDFYHDLKNEIKLIADYLSINISKKQIGKINYQNNYKIRKRHLNQNNLVNTDRIGNNIFDKTTLLHSSHIQGVHPGQFKQFLSLDEIKKIEELAKDWLVQHDYKLV